MIYAEALSRILESARSLPDLPIETVGLMESVGRTCARELRSPCSIPPFDNSSMDGFAVRSSQTRHASEATPLRFKILGTIAAGDLPPSARQPGSDAPGVWEIMTGAPFPEGFDAAVKVEDTLVLNGEIEINSPLSFHQNWRGEGEDFARGAPVLSRGQRISVEHVLALASLGVAEIPVFRKPRIGLLSTGRELVEFDWKGDPAETGRIRNSTAPYLVMALRELGAEVTHLGTFGDEPGTFRVAMERALKEGFDLLVTTGAVSMGKFDFVTESLAALGADRIFHKVEIRPGRPLLFARFERGPVVFGLPGNPISGVVGARFFMEPFLRELQRREQEAPLWAQLAAPVSKPEGLRCFYKSQLSLGNGGAKIRVLPGQMSFMVSPLLESNAWAILPEGKSDFLEGERIEIRPLRSGFHHG